MYPLLADISLKWTADLSHIIGSVWTVISLVYASGHSHFTSSLFKSHIFAQFFLRLIPDGEKKKAK